MKGLLFKDLCGLKKMLRAFGFACIGTLTVAILVALSSRYGNLTYIKKVLGTDFYCLFIRAICVFPLLLPIAFLWQVNDCFAMDETAGFAKIEGQFPIKVTKQVGARYLLFLLFGVVSLLLSMVSAGIMSTLTDTVALLELLVYPTVFALALLFFCSLFIPIMYRFGSKISNIVMAFTVAVLLAVLFGGLLHTIASMTEAEELLFLNTILEKIQHTESYIGWFIFLSAFSTILSYFFSVIIVKKNRKAGR